jgi:hypothetical protein
MKRRFQSSQGRSPAAEDGGHWYVFFEGRMTSDLPSLPIGACFFSSILVRTKIEREAQEELRQSAAEVGFVVVEVCRSCAVNITELDESDPANERWLEFARRLSQSGQRRVLDDFHVFPPDTK